MKNTYRQRMRVWSIGKLVVVAVLFATAVTPVFAEEVGSERGSLSALMEEVVVTARKRDENSQETPISITALSGESLEVRGITSVADIGNITPNLTYQNSPGAGGSSSVATVYIRGIGQRDFLGTIDNGVGFYIDDVYIARTVGAVVDLLDIERVEVLRGPQGTLFGRNSIGGAMKLHTKKPDNEMAGYADLAVGTDSQVKFRGTFNLPLSDRFKTSFSALVGQQDGYVDRPAGGDLGDDDTLAFRANAQWDVTDTLTVTLGGDFSQEEENGPAFILADAGTLAPGGFAGFHNNVLNGAVCGYPGGITSTNPQCYNDQWESEDNLGTAPTFSDTDTWGVRLGVDWALSDNITFKSITAQRDLDSQFARDADASPLLITHFFDDFEAEQFSQEFQLIGSSFENKLDWIVGLYYFDEEGSNTNILEFAIANFLSGADFGTTSEAAFAQVTWHATERLHATLGLRHTEEEKTYDPIQVVGPNNIGLPVGLNIVPEGENKTETTELTPSVNIAYDVGNDALVYVSYTEGFRSGGFVQRIFPPLPFVPEFGPETVESYEIGFKYQTSDNRFKFNASVFYADYTDIQVRTQNPGFIGFFEANVGDGEIRGLELELAWQPADTWVVEATYGYTDAEYTEIRVDPPLVAQVTLDSEFDHVPENSASLSLSKAVDFDGGSSLVARISGSYHSGYFNNPDNTRAVETDAVDLWDLTAQWTSADTRITISGGIRNITDDEFLAAGYNNTAIGFTEHLNDRGRQWYLGGRYHF